MPVSLVRSKWVSGNLVFYESVAGNGGTVIFGESGAGLNMTLWGATSSFRMRWLEASNRLDIHGQTKFHFHQTTQTYGTELKYDFIGAATLGWGLVNTSQVMVNKTAGGLYANGGVARLAASFTMTGGALVGTYSQAHNNGTMNGANVFMDAGYFLIEDGGVFTQVNHVAGLWLDSHLSRTVSSGSTNFLHITNNGSTTWDSAIFVYANHKITNLFKISTASGMVGSNNAGDATFANLKTIKVDLDGTTHYLVAAQTIS